MLKVHTYLPTYLALPPPCSGRKEKKKKDDKGERSKSLHVGKGGAGEEARISWNKHAAYFGLRPLLVTLSMAIMAHTANGLQ